MSRLINTIIIRWLCLMGIAIGTLYLLGLRAHVF